jgi:hypothetical protein
VTELKLRLDTFATDMEGYDRAGRIELANVQLHRQQEAS